MKPAGQWIGDGLRLDMVTSKSKLGPRACDIVSYHLSHVTQRMVSSLWPRHIAVRSSQVFDPLASSQDQVESESRKMWRNRGGLR